MNKSALFVLMMVSCGFHSSSIKAGGTNYAVMAGGAALASLGAYHIGKGVMNATIHKPLNAIVHAPLENMQIKWLTDLEGRITSEEHQTLTKAINVWQSSLGESVEKQTESFKHLKKTIEDIKENYPCGVLKGLLSGVATLGGVLCILLAL